jgi:hypothetical protein
MDASKDPGTKLDSGGSAILVTWYHLWVPFGLARSESTYGPQDNCWCLPGHGAGVASQEPRLD